MVSKNVFRVITLLVFLGMLANLAGAPNMQAAANPTSISLFLPIMRKSAPLTIFGADATPLSTSSGVNQLGATGATWTRANDILWSDVEAVKGTYDWSKVSGFEQALLLANNKYLTPIVNIKGIPVWAQSVSNNSCAPIKSDNLVDFGNFMNALVSRYSKTPFNVKYWELMNEADIDPTETNVNSLFGCWGDKNDPYFGGGYFAEMLKVAYPQMKAADPRSVVLAGGLMMDCGPNSASCPRLNFIDGILLNGGGAYMDALSFHVYEYYGNQLGYFGNAAWGSRYDKEQTTVAAKSIYLKNKLVQYNIPNLPLYVTEVALLCNPTNDPSVCTNSTFDETKSYYVARSAADAIQQGVKALVWYKVVTAFDACKGASISSWCYTGLLSSNLTPRPPMQAFTVAYNAIASGQLVSSGQSQPGVVTHQFNRGNRKVWLMWSLDGTPQTVNLATMPVAIYDAVGVPLPLSTNFSVDMKPVYVEWTP